MALALAYKPVLLTKQPLEAGRFFFPTPLVLLNLRFHSSCSPLAKGARDTGAGKLEAHKTPWCKDMETHCSSAAGTACAFQWDTIPAAPSPQTSETSDTNALLGEIQCGLDHKYVVWDFLLLQLLQFPEGMALHHRPASLAVESQV